MLCVCILHIIYTHTHTHTHSLKSGSEKSFSRKTFVQGNLATVTGRDENVLCYRIAEHDVSINYKVFFYFAFLYNNNSLIGQSTPRGYRRQVLYLGSLSSCQFSMPIYSRTCNLYTYNLIIIITNLIVLLSIKYYI